MIYSPEPIQDDAKCNVESKMSRIRLGLQYPCQLLH